MDSKELLILVATMTGTALMAAEDIAEYCNDNDINTTYTGGGEKGRRSLQAWMEDALLHGKQYTLEAIMNTEILENLKFLMSTHIDNIENKINYNNLIVINNLLYKFISYHVPEIRKSKLFISEK